LHASLALLVLLVIALVLGRVARYLILHASRMLGRQPALHWITDFRQNKVFQRLAQMTPSLVIQFGLHLVPELSKTAMILLGNVALAFTILFLMLSISALLNLRVGNWIEMPQVGADGDVTDISLRGCQIFCVRAGNGLPSGRPSFHQLGLMNLSAYKTAN
jgi:hypothetical protein